jgi:hypothetical protein
MGGYKNASLFPNLAGEFALTFSLNPKPLTAISHKTPSAMCNTMCVKQTIAENIRPAAANRIDISIRQLSNLCPAALS